MGVVVPFRFVKPSVGVILTGLHSNVLLINCLLLIVFGLKGTSKSLLILSPNSYLSLRNIWCPLDTRKKLKSIFI